MPAERKMLTGNYAAAHGARLARAEVVPVYPITPQTHIMEKMAEFIEKGELDAEFVPVESEHSAMAVAIAAQAESGAVINSNTARRVKILLLFILKLSIVLVLARLADFTNGRSYHRDSEHSFTH